MDQVLAKGACDPVPSSGLLKNSLLQHHIPRWEMWGSSLRSSKGWEKPGVDMNCWRCEGMDGEERPWPSIFRGRLYILENPSQVTLGVRGL